MCDCAHAVLDFSLKHTLLHNLREKVEPDDFLKEGTLIKDMWAKVKSQRSAEKLLDLAKSMNL